MSLSYRWTAEMPTDQRDFPTGTQRAGNSPSPASLQACPSSMSVIRAQSVPQRVELPWPLGRSLRFCQSLVGYLNLLSAAPSCSGNQEGPGCRAPPAMPLWHSPEDAGSAGSYVEQAVPTAPAKGVLCSELHGSFVLPESAQRS